MTEQVFSAPTAPVVAVAAPPPTTPAPVVDAIAGGVGINLVRSDLNFILKQIKIAEAHAARHAAERSDPEHTPRLRPALGRRQREQSAQSGRHRSDRVRCSRHDVPAPGAARMFHAAEVQPAGFFGPGTRPARRRPPMRKPAATSSTRQPRVISNLIVDQTANNPAAVAAAAAQPGRRDRHQPRPRWPVRHRR